jgi:CheY-like chemotaxis protein
MPETRLRLLVVVDDPSLRTSFLLVFCQLGYVVRSASDGFSALSEMRKEIPDILLSDLNMPGMSGFELLSVVRRRFPAIPVIAMSGAYSGRAVPPGVAADSFFQKGSGMDRLLRFITAVPKIKRAPPAACGAEAPIWIAQNGYDSSGDPYVTIACPECMRTFPHALNGATSPISETNCVYCGVSIRFAIAATEQYA